ncbi:MAG: FtsQ-type POTRA domain-containing protein [Nitrospirota bacterium]|nr:FtsQ-type POTRA domain-containing protein [Nitrospirota bacterium]
MSRGLKKKSNRIKKERKLFARIFLHPLFLKSVFFIALTGVIGLSGVYLYGKTADIMRINRIEVTGNKHLSDKEIISLMKLGQGESMLRISSRELSERVLESPWIRDVVIRKELPHTLIVKVKEAEPLALLKRKGRLYIVSRGGEVLEELSQTIAFLPVIKMDSIKKSLLKEALKVAGIVREDAFFSDEEIEIIAKTPEEMTLKIGDLTIKIGKGDYRRKLARLVQLEDEIVRRGIPAGYVDLRFSRRVIVRAAKGRG